jgi:hypothetical protein
MERKIGGDRMKKSDERGKDLKERGRKGGSL